MLLSRHEIQEIKLFPLFLPKYCLYGRVTVREFEVIRQSLAIIHITQQQRAFTETCMCSHRYHCQNVWQ